MNWPPKLRKLQSNRIQYEVTIMAEAVSKVGIISCSGEEIPEGTIARQAVRRVLEALRPQQTVTLCLPLFLAGEEGERRFAREHSTITVDGCSKLCAKSGTEKFSGNVSASLVVSDIIGDRAKQCHRSLRNADKSDEEAIWIVAERVAAEVDALMPVEIQSKTSETQAAGNACCACSSPSPDGKLEINGKSGKLEINGKSIAISGLPLIFQHLQKKGLQPGNGCTDKLLETVRIYHAIDAGEEAEYRSALAAAYQKYCQRQTM
jgi:hypothetical protein